MPAPTLIASSPQSGGITAINGTVTGIAGSQVAVEVFDAPPPPPPGATAPGCLAEGKTFLGSITVTIGSDGTAPVDIAAANPVLGDQLTATATTTLAGDNTPSTSVFSNCSTVTDGGPDNTAWTRAQTITLDSNGSGSASQSLDLTGQARWYKVPITPGGRVQVDLTNLPANYDVVLFSDIGQAAQASPRPP